MISKFFIILFRQNQRPLSNTKYCNKPKTIIVVFAESPCYNGAYHSRERCAVSLGICGKRCHRPGCRGIGRSTKGGFSPLLEPQMISCLQARWGLLQRVNRNGPQPVLVGICVVRIRAELARLLAIGS